MKSYRLIALSLPTILMGFLALSAKPALANPAAWGECVDQCPSDWESFCGSHAGGCTLTGSSCAPPGEGETGCGDHPLFATCTFEC